MDAKKTTVTLAGRNYPILIAPEEESKIMATVGEIRSTVLDFAARYPKMDSQDHMAMAMLALLTNKRSLSQMDDADIDALQSMITKIDNHIGN